MKLGGLLLAIALPWLGACRIGFDALQAAQDAAGSDGGSDAPPVGPPPPTLACGAGVGFEIGVPPQSASATVISFAAAATDSAYYAFVLDSNGAAHGFSYPFAGDQVVTGADDAAAFDGGVASISAAGVPEGVLAVVEYGPINSPQPPTGSALIPLDANLVSRGTPQRTAGWFAIDHSLARASDGTLGLLGQISSGDVVAKLVSATGVDLGAAHTVVDSSDGASLPTIGAADAGFFVSWSAGSVSPNAVRLELLNASLAVTPPPPPINDGAKFDSFMPHAAYTPEHGVYLSTWYEKPPAGDAIYASLRNGQLGAVMAPLQLSTHGSQPRVAAGKDDFLVVWRDVTSGGLSAARVAPDGTVTKVSIMGAVANYLGFDVVSRAGQPVLVWLEGATAPDPLILHIDPLCG